MKEEFKRQLINTLMPYIRDEDFDNVKMEIDFLCKDYNIEKRETSLTVYTGDANEEIIQRFLISKVAAGRSPRTLSFYKNTLIAFFDRVSKRYDEITTEDIRLYLAVRVQRDKVSKVTANNERRNISSFYDWLQKEEILLKNPMSKIETIKVDKKKKKAFTQMELEKIRNECKTSREEAVIEVLISTWCRVTELVNIKLTDIEGDAVLVHGKGSKDRLVYLTPKAVLTLDKYISERQDDNPYLFPRAKYAGDIAKMARTTKRNTQKDWYKIKNNVDEERHMESSTAETMVRNLGKKAGVEKAHPHRFRRTGATMALQAGMELITVSKLLGHENIGTTQIYLDVSDDDLKAAHNKFC